MSLSSSWFFPTLGATQVAFNVEEAEGINGSSSSIGI